MIYLCSTDDTAGRQCISAPPTSLFLSLMPPRKGQPFPPERRNCSHTFRGVLQFRLPSVPQRYNTLDFPRKVVCQQGCCSPLLETQSQRVFPFGYPFGGSYGVQTSNVNHFQELFAMWRQFFGLSYMEIAV